MLDILISIVIGCLLGIVTGLAPGIHINLVSLLALTFSPFLLRFTSPLNICISLASMSITHTFLDAIPSIFLGAPNQDQILSALPGHRMLLEGQGYQAVMLTLVGSLFSLILVILASPLLIILVNKFYPLIKSYIGYILLIVVCFLIFKESNSKLWAIIVFLLAGVLGITVFNLNLKDPLFPMLSGLFGLSTLVISVYEDSFIPEQRIYFPHIEPSEATQAVSSSVLTSSLVSFLPGLGPAQAAILGSQITRNLSIRGFLILTGGLNTVNMLVAFLALYVISKARNGSVVVISKILKTFTLNHLVLFIAVSLISAAIATLLTIYLSRIFSNIISKVNYKILCFSILIFIVILCFILSGPLGFLVLLTSTSLGVIPHLKEIGKNHLMGCLLLPIILFFLI